MADLLVDPAGAEFGTVAGWTAAVARDLGTDYYEPAACRGSGSPVWLDWLADRMNLLPGRELLDVGAGVGGPSAYAARSRGVRPLLVEPQPTACDAARALFGLPVCCTGAAILPIRTGAVPAVWCLGVLCTVEERTGQRQLLRELRRVVIRSGRVGLLVLVAGSTPIPDKPIGNNFPTAAELTDMLVHAGLDVVDAVDAAELPPTPPEWITRSEVVETELRRRYGWTEGWQVAQHQSERIGELLFRGLISTQLLVARPVSVIPPRRPTAQSI